MVLTQSTMMSLGTIAPEFQLIDVVSQQSVSLKTISPPPATLIIFLCCHCPFVKHIENELSKLGQDYQEKWLNIIAISSNDVENYPADAPERLAEMAERLTFNFPVCCDHSQDVAKAYTAACTPDFFLFGHDLRLIYRGQLDDSRPSNGLPVTGQDLRAAIDAALCAQPVSNVQKPSIGCNIKWKTGEAPSYFSS